MEESRTLTLLDLERQYQGVVREIQEAHGELTEESEKRFDETCKMLCEKVDGYFVVSQRLEVEMDLWKTRKEGCEAVERSYRNALARLKERLRYVLETRDDKTLQGEFVRYSLAKARHSLVLNDLELPREYKKIRIVIEPDKEKIEADLKLGKKIPGAALKDNFSVRTGKPKT